jgi:uncharacterized repeat protein (TIGR03803 family)
MREKLSSSRRLLVPFALCLALVLVAFPAWSQSYKVIHSFTTEDQLVAGSTLAQDKLGNLYGASWESTKKTCPGGVACGAIYEISPTGAVTVLHEFTGNPDGAYPDAVTVDATGTLYGTTYYGGTSTFQECGNGGCGTLFQLTNSGAETILHSFDAPPEDGIVPQSGVIVGPNGELYGTTTYGGAGPIGSEGDGTIFEYANSREGVLYSFTDGTDGGLPSAGLLLNAGSLYGTAQFGGTGPCFVGGYGDGCGTVFKFDKSGETTLYEFQDGPDGASPAGSLIIDRAGNLYGTTVLGGEFNCSFSDPPGCGVVFKLSPTGQETVLYAFTGGADGAWPSDALVMDAAGNLYGTAYFGGNFTCNQLGCGTIFKIDTQGKFSLMHTFKGADGAYPRALIGNGSKLYGVTNDGGTDNKGVVYELTIQ